LKATKAQKASLIICAFCAFLWLGMPYLPLFRSVTEGTFIGATEGTFTGATGTFTGAAEGTLRGATERPFRGTTERAFFPFSAVHVRSSLYLFR